MQDMTIKQKKAVAIMVENGGVASTAMIKAGYSPNTAKTPSKLTSVPEVQDALQQLLKQKGITLDKALQPIADGLTADKVIIVGKGEDAFADLTPDHTTRMQASDRALKLLNITGKDTQPFDLQDLTDALNNNVDEVELTHAVFKRKDVPEHLPEE